ncbi:ABC transporter ATP-binding protein [Hoeflea sp. WL0058]|uniref:ABC transporter ATP-binding protein n=1 Tax=Flavimaribacter sediminis TaxID=2865987 RepID=A0AAE3D0T9_9HYPH|nr:ABC transporter ATP-binding protein [Flavimaribacter sediminis]
MNSLPPNKRSRSPAGAAFAATLTFDEVSHGYDGHATIRNLSLTAQAGKILCLLGPSGSGKTTLLRLAAGIEAPTRGRVLLDGKEVSGPSVFVPPEYRGVGFVFQDFALFPHMNVLDNVKFGLTALSQKEASDTGMASLERVGLAHYADQYPHALSGGEQQRVALARALAPRPSVLLMDEPFSGLDTRLRDSVRTETLSILAETGATGVIVTHDAEEAMRMADTIALLKDGALAQLGTAEQIYRAPSDLFVAGFFAEITVFDVCVTAGQVDTPLGRFHAKGWSDGEKLSVAVRVSGIGIVENGGSVPARIVYRRFLGDYEQFALSVPGVDKLVQARMPVGTLKSDLQDVSLCVNERDILLFK